MKCCYEFCVIIFFFSTQVAAHQLEGRQIQEDHDRLMERHSRLLQESAAKELSARNRLEQERRARDNAEKVSREAEEKVRAKLEDERQTHRVHKYYEYCA